MCLGKLSATAQLDCACVLCCIDEQFTCISVIQLSNDKASTAFFGWVVAAFSMGQLVASPVFGIWFDHRPPREPVIVALLISLLANMVYCYAEAFPGSSPHYVLMAARVFVGIGAGQCLIFKNC